MASDESRKILGLLDLPLEIRLQIWSNIIGPQTIYPCGCALKATQCTSHRLGTCCQNTSAYRFCDNRILRVSRQIFSEVAPLVRQSEKRRVFVLCNNLCLDNFFKSLQERDWNSVNNLRVDLFVGIGTAGQDDWFLSQSQRWAKRYVMGTLQQYDRGRNILIVPATQVRQDKSGRRSLTVDVRLG
jgi:hypothetical protein